jgi:hypothetical protein
MIVKRFIAVFYPSAEFEQTTRLTRIQQDTFKTEGRILVKPGWLEVYGRRPGVAAGKDELCPVRAGESASVEEIELLAEETKPPARMTESTLLSAMEGAGKLIDDEALREAMAERGLGTPATRAATIEGLISQKYLAREGRELFVSGSGMRLIELVREMEIEGLYSPKLTGDWEFKLRQMEQGNLKRSDFMKEIISYTNEICTKARNAADLAKSEVFPDLKVTCPMCGAASLKQTEATYECREPECKFKAKKHIAGRLLTEPEAIQLFTTKLVGPLTGFRSKFNKPFDAALEMDAKFKINFVFEGEDRDAPPELTEEQLIGPLGCYLISTAAGLLTLKYVTTPVYADKTGTVLNATNIIGTPSLEYGLRDLLNEVFWEVDFAAATGEYSTRTMYVDSTSLTAFAQAKRLTVSSQGLDSGDSVFITARNVRLFGRFAQPYPRYKVKATLAMQTIEEGDVIQFMHPTLPDVSTGSRGIDSAHIVEVVSASVNLDQGVCEFELLDTPWSFTKTVVISDLSTNYDASSAADHVVYGWIGRAADNKVGAALDDGYLVLEG